MRCRFVVAVAYMFCRGAMMFGGWGNEDERECTRIIHRALDAGINFIDTADVYGGPQSPDMEQGYGISEEIIGRPSAWPDSRDGAARPAPQPQPSARSSGLSSSGRSPAPARRPRRPASVWLAAQGFW